MSPCKSTKNDGGSLLENMNHFFKPHPFGIFCYDIFSLLTLTSFPFRVLYANRAYTTLTGNKNIIGEPFQNILADECQVCPSLATCSSPMGNKNHAIRRITSSTSNALEELVCNVHVHSVYLDPARPEKGLRHYAVRLEKIDLF